MLGQRIKEARTKAGLSQEALADKLNIARRTVLEYEKGLSDPKVSTLQRIAEICGVDSAWLLTGNKAQGTTGYYVPPSDTETYPVQRLSLHASAGTGIQNEEVEVLETVQIPRFFFRTPQNPDHLKLITVVGDSMEPTLHDGDHILIDTSATATIDGIYAVIIGDEIFVKRLQFRLDGTVKIISDNPAYEPQLYDPREQGDIPFRILGRRVLTVTY